MKCEISLTQGSLKKNILLFSLPLIFSNLLQVLFNMTDIAVIGRFAGPIALGAVGSTPMILFLFESVIFLLHLSKILALADTSEDKYLQE